MREAERFRTGPRLEIVAAAPERMRGIEYVVLARRAAQQVEGDEAGYLAQMRVAVEPSPLEVGGRSGEHLEAVHGDEHGGFLTSVASPSPTPLPRTRGRGRVGTAVAPSTDHAQLRARVHHQAAVEGEVILGHAPGGEAGLELLAHAVAVQLVQPLDRAHRAGLVL